MSSSQLTMTVWRILRLSSMPDIASCRRRRILCGLGMFVLRCSGFNFAFINFLARKHKNILTRISKSVQKTGDKFATVTWTGIQQELQQAQSDVLILLDCCSSGVADGGEGNGVTELLAACPFGIEANGVGPYSFTNSLTIELRLLSQKKLFSVGDLYSNMYRRNQSHLHQGVANERYPPPIHLRLRSEEKSLEAYSFLSSGKSPNWTQNSVPLSIQNIWPHQGSPINQSIAKYCLGLARRRQTSLYILGLISNMGLCRNNLANRSSQRNLYHWHLLKASMCVRKSRHRQ